jgi:hypothetical integral membrane protein (TIGR02206 family)
MDRNITHYTVPIGSPIWMNMNLGLLAFFILVFGASYKANQRRLDIIRYSLGSFLAADYVYSQIHALMNGTWDASISLPLQLCSFSQLLAIALCFTKKQWVYEFLIFWSAGAIHAFLTPEISEGYSVYNATTYTIGHGGIIVTAFFATFKLHLTPRPLSWWKVFLYTQLVLPIIGSINYFLGANYMYLAQRPDANNPFIIGEWPWYIVSLEAVIIVHFYAFYWIHKRVVQVRYNLTPTT